MQIVLLSGEIGSGKSTLCSYLEQRFGFHVLKTKLVMEQLALERSRKGIDPNRIAMQSFGQRLDRQTKGRWVETALTKLLRTIPDTRSGVVVDAVRIRDQIRIIRRAYGYSVAHVHLTASDVALAERYKRRTDSGLRELSKYSEVKKSKTEAAVHKLAEIADIVIDTELCTPEGVLVRAASHLNLYAGDHHRCVDVIVGGQFGSEGKGHVVSYLAREYQLLVRVGGPNAGHKVFLEPEPYTHHLLPSGTLRNPNASLILAPGCVLDVLQLRKEIAECNVDSRRLSIDPQAMIISPKDRQDEAKLVKKIGSTGQGVGFATARRITHRLSETSPVFSHWLTANSSFSHRSCSLSGWQCLLVLLCSARVIFSVRLSQASASHCRYSGPCRRLPTTDHACSHEHRQYPTLCSPTRPRHVHENAGLSVRRESKSGYNGRVVELAVEGGVPDVAKYTLKATIMKCTGKRVKVITSLFER